MSTRANETDAINEKQDWKFARKKNRELIEDTLKRLPIIFRLIFIGMTTGIMLILFGASLAIFLTSQPMPAIITVASGSITLFFEAICLAIYKATLAQIRVYIGEPLTEDEFEAARRKIQYYMHENLNQVRWIFWLTLVAMFLGFLIILSGAGLAIIIQDQLAPSIVVTLSGVLVEFLGATFLVIYKSTMEQAKGYVNILDRINAVGQSVKLVGEIDPSKRSENLAKIATEILSLHSVEKLGEGEE